MSDSQTPSVYIMVPKFLCIILLCQLCLVKDIFHGYGLGNSIFFFEKSLKCK